MGDKICVAPGNGPDPLITGATWLEATASGEQTGIGSGTTLVTNIDTIVQQDDPFPRMALESGGLRINKPGFVVVDFAFTVERTTPAVIGTFHLELIINTTVAMYNGRYSPQGPSTAGVSGALPQAPRWQSFDAGLATWFNRGDFIRPRITHDGPGSVRVLRHNDPVAQNGPVGYLTALHLGMGLAPYRGSVWP